MNTRTFRIDYVNAGQVIRHENRTHETGVLPSEKLCKGALHSICLDNEIKNFDQAEARLFETTSGKDVLLKTYKLEPRRF